MVKFYNDFKGFGMITEIINVTGGDSSYGEDFFVHVNDLVPNTQQPRGNRRLYTGEYVSFDVSDPHIVGGEDASGKKQRGVSVTGAFGGPLLMEHGSLMYESYSRTHINRNKRFREAGRDASHSGASRVRPENAPVDL